MQESYNESIDLFKLQQTNESLSYDVKKIIDNKSRIENESFKLKLEIQKVREQNNMINLKFDRSSIGQEEEEDDLSYRPSYNGEEQMAYKRFSNQEDENLEHFIRIEPRVSSPSVHSFKKNMDLDYSLQNSMLEKEISRVATLTNRGGDFVTTPSIDNDYTLPSIYSQSRPNYYHNLHSVYDSPPKTIRRNQSRQSNTMSGRTYYHQHSVDMGEYNTTNIQVLPPLLSGEEFENQLRRLNGDLKEERTLVKDIQQKLSDSEHKRHEHLKRNQEMSRHVLDLERELKVIKQRFKDLLLKKSSGILREQFVELESQFTMAQKQLKEYKVKEQNFAFRVEAVKQALKTQTDKMREAMEFERGSLFNQIENHKILEREQKLLIIDLQKKLAFKDVGIVEQKKPNSTQKLEQTAKSIHDQVKEEKLATNQEPPANLVTQAKNNQAIINQESKPDPSSSFIEYKTLMEEKVTALKEDIQNKTLKISYLERDFQLIKRAKYASEIEVQEARVRLEESREEVSKWQIKYESALGELQKREANVYLVEDLVGYSRNVEKQRPLYITKDFDYKNKQKRGNSYFNSRQL